MKGEDYVQVVLVESVILTANCDQTNEDTTTWFIFLLNFNLIFKNQFLMVEPEYFYLIYKVRLF